MTAVCVITLCAAALLAQWRAQQHERLMQSGHTLLFKVEERVSALERRKTDFDSAAFEELKSKVEVLKLAQGIRGR